MHFRGAVLSGLAVASTLASPLSKRRGLCGINCVRTAIWPFVSAAGEEGFRQALGAHNTTEICMGSPGCRDTLQIFVEEITDMVFKDLVDQDCDTHCLIKTARIAAGQAGVVAMAVGQKHFYGTDNLWNRWSARQMLELDQAVRQLRGTEEMLEVDPKTGSQTYALTRSEEKFDHYAFRYSGMPEIPLLLRQRISRVDARRILSSIPGWGADPAGAAPDTDSWLFGDAIRHFADTLHGMYELDSNGNWVTLSNYQQDLVRDTYLLIEKEKGSALLQGFTYFLYADRLFNKSRAENMRMQAGESYTRLMRDMTTSPNVTALKGAVTEEGEQSWYWAWRDHAYGVLTLDELRASKEALELRGKTPRLTQWVTDSVAEPLKNVEGGLTHQPWTVPWFFEYRSNISHTQQLRPDMPYDEAQDYLNWIKENANGTVIRGYTMEFRVLEGILKAKSIHDVLDERGAIKDFDMISLPDLNPDDEESHTVFLAITGDGRAWKRFLSKVVVIADGKRYYDVLDEERKPLYTEDGKPIKVVYDEATGLLQTRYGRALTPLDKNLQGW